VPITDAKNQAWLTHNFLAAHCEGTDLLAMVRYHDEPFALYRQLEAKGKYNQDRFGALLASIRDWNLFLAFNIIDGCTPGKSRDQLYWLFCEVAAKVESKFTGRCHWVIRADSACRAIFLSPPAHSSGTLLPLCALTRYSS
jgi:hypothetical protein